MLTSGCKVTVKNDLVVQHSDEIEAFAKDTYDAFYAHNVDFLLDNAHPEVSGFTKPNIDAVHELISESSSPEFSIVGARGNKSENTKKYYISVFYTPRDAGREDLKVTLTQADDKCCEIVGVNLQVRVGEQFIMDTVDNDAKTSPQNGEETP